MIHGLKIRSRTKRDLPLDHTKERHINGTYTKKAPVAASPDATRDTESTGYRYCGTGLVRGDNSSRSCKRNHQKVQHFHHSDFLDTHRTGGEHSQWNTLNFSSQHFVSHPDNANLLTPLLLETACELDFHVPKSVIFTTATNDVSALPSTAPSYKGISYLTFPHFNLFIMRFNKNKKMMKGNHYYLCLFIPLSKDFD